MIEKQIAEIRNAVERYRRVQQSPELQEFLSLQKVVEDRDFVEKKRYLLNTRYRNTSYYSEAKEYDSVASSLTVMRWKWLSSLSAVEEYIDFEQTPSYYRLADKEAVKSDAFLRKMKRMDGSILIRDYKRCAASDEVRSYLKLRPVVENPEWKAQNAFWQDENRWYRTPEGRQDMRFEQLKRDRDLEFYFKQSEAQIEEWESIKTVFNEQFLDKSNWDFGFYTKNEKARQDLSVAAEETAMNEGRNTAVTGRGIQLEVRREERTSLSLDAKFGLGKKTYAYTGDTMHTANHYMLNRGLIVAKVRFVGPIDGALFLTAGDGTEPIVLAKADGKNFDWQTITYELNSITPYAFAAKAYLKAGKKAEGKMEIAYISVYSR